MSIRQPAVAGLFYSAAAEELMGEVDAFLADAASFKSIASYPSLEAPVKALVVPHAGYIYSGAIAARAFEALRPQCHSIKRVVLLGPAHRVYVTSMAVPEVKVFNTPLGDIQLDKPGIEACLASDGVVAMEQAHEQEHCLEVQLPFLQLVLEQFTLIPLVVGHASLTQVQTLLEVLWGGPETLIVISSDLSHFEDYASAKQIDRRTCHAIECFAPDDIEPYQACGSVPLKGFMGAAKAHGLKVQTLGLCNSGDTAGNKDRVVGYGSWAFTQ